MENLKDEEHGECGKEYQQLAECLQELKVQRDRIDVLTEQAKIYEADIKKYQESLVYYMEEKKKAELKLASYEDKTPISDDFLIRNGFTKRVKDYLFCDDDIEIIANCFSAEMGIWYIYIGSLDHAVDSESLIICTVGQMRMFLAIEGLSELAKQLK